MRAAVRTSIPASVRGALIVAVATALLHGTARAQVFVVTPSAEMLIGEPVSIRLTGLPADAEVTLSARRAVDDWDGQKRPFRSEARFTTSAAGTLDLATAVPLNGSSYSGADLRGLFWSMTPEAAMPVAAAAAAAAGAALPPPGEWQLEARRSDELLARLTLRPMLALPQVQQRDAAGFPGARFAVLPGAAKRPGLIVLGGSEGGTRITQDAPVFASRGYAVLALPYYSPAQWGAAGPLPPELPALPTAFADIPLERLAQAREWLAGQPEVDASRIGVMGTSKGAEFALLAAARMPWIKAVVAMVPSDVVWEGWGPDIKPDTRSSFAWQGRPLPFVPYKDMEQEFAGFATGAEVRIRRPQDKGRAAHPGRVAPARIAVEDIAAPVMVIGGHDDQVWDSGGMAENIARARDAARRTTVALVYRDAGHALGGHGWSPTTQYNAGPSKLGGTPEGNARAQAEVYPKVFEFLARHLGPSAAPKRAGASVPDRR